MCRTFLKMSTVTKMRVLVCMYAYEICNRNELFLQVGKRLHRETLPDDTRSLSALWENSWPPLFTDETCFPLQWGQHFTHGWCPGDYQEH